MRRTLLLAWLLATTVPCGASDLIMWYATPAAKGMNEALPIGNGRIGALIYGGAESERFVLNDSSLWTGDEATATGGYDQMGSYQMLGELLVNVSGAVDGTPSTKPAVRCTSKHKAFTEHEEVQFAFDGDPATKWCVEHHGRPVVCEVRLPEAIALTKYAFVSGNDTPLRDPSTWELAGSTDGRRWTALDRHQDEPPMASRGATKSYSFTNTTAFKRYRFTFQPNLNVKHFQVGEISLPGVTPCVAADAGVPAGYRRSLDLTTATHTVAYTSGGVTFCRETFASHPADVIVARFSADKPGAYTGSIALHDSHGAVTKAEGRRIGFAGTLDNGLKYETQVAVVPLGGTVRAHDDHIEFAGCDGFTLFVAAGTNYAMDYAKKYRGSDPHSRVAAAIEAASAKKFDELEAEHVAGHQSLFNRVKLDLGPTSTDHLAFPTDKRKELYRADGNDRNLEEVMFQYGRYLMISCSRPGCLPANLQGLWCDSNNPPWHSDYHANINIQMNYWPAEPANLSECHTPLFDLITSQLEPWRKATAAEKRFTSSAGRAHGWAVRTSHGIHGDMGWQWDVTANAWYCQHFWWHYEFSGDKEWLRRVAYPVIKEVCEFWQARLKALPDGRLVVPNGWSPEHGPTEDGVSYSQQIVWDLFSNYVKAAEVLGVDSEYRATIAAMRDKLVGPKIGRWGQLQEWMTDRDDPEDHHRHTSHLFAVYPGQQISVAQTPEFAAAAKKSLVARGDVGDVREWSYAWRTALYARLRDGEAAHRQFHQLIATACCRNLFGLHPPMQMDGNFGITAGVCEMLMQSQAGEIELLPALPKCWPTGSVKGLRARGGYTVDIKWDGGKTTRYRIASATPGAVKVRVNGETKTVQAEKL